MGIHNQKLGKVKKFQEWVVEDFFIKGQKTVGGGGGGGGGLQRPNPSSCVMILKNPVIEKVKH